MRGVRVLGVHAPRLPEEPRLDQLRGACWRKEGEELNSRKEGREQRDLTHKKAKMFFLKKRERERERERGRGAGGGGPPLRRALGQRASQGQSGRSGFQQSFGLQDIMPAGLREGEDATSTCTTCNLS